MKRSEINTLILDATKCFEEHGWALPPKPKWDVTDFGLGNWRSHGLVLINLAEEPEYCEKLMYAKQGMSTPAHCHRKKKEDIICRSGALTIRVWAGQPGAAPPGPVRLKVNGEMREVQSGSDIILNSGERVTLEPWIYHEFEPASEECIIGEVSTANDDLHDNYFVREDIGRFPEIEEDEFPLTPLVSDRQ